MSGDPALNQRVLSVLHAPHVSEKSTRLSEHNQYVFAVAPDATKADVKSAVEQMFDVSVVSVNMANIKGKLKMFRFRPGRKASVRKAYVRLAEGQSIDVAAGKA
ncbi:MAG: LSU ribosomal protein L23p (L23Ae) [Rhodanobacteraceae bacterium]|jgi:large subunit ribosomal protein L23|nr:MAG: LSU ribosomal protein L23p (L23Ae) [Rhodanobacteraceae bacterium]